MNIGDIYYLVLGLIQGLTEFLPISSSAHLVLFPHLLGIDDHGLVTDVAAHVGTLLAVILYFRDDLEKMTSAWFNSGFSLNDHDSRFVWYLVVATLPVAFTGFLTRTLVEDYLRNPLVIACTTILFAVFLWWTDHAGRKSRQERDIVWRDVIIIGLFQVLALVPGTSRSGITISAGLLLGLGRKAAARFAFLLSIPIIFLAGGYEVVKLIMSSSPVNWSAIVTVSVTSFASAYLTIHLFIRLLDYTGMLPYVVYRLLLGGVLFYVFI